MLLVRIFIIAVLLAVLIQDFKQRAVYWFWFPLLAVLFLTCSYSHKTGIDILELILINWGFVASQLILISAYFSLKYRRFINVTNQLLGWGDILFLMSTACYLSPLNYIAFYIFSLITVLFCWSAYYVIAQKKIKQIPLAGLQSAIFVVCLIFDWYNDKLDLTSDYWLLCHLYK